MYKEYGEINQNIYAKHTSLDVSFRQYCNKYGGLKQICKDLGIEYSYYNEVSKEQALERGRMLLEQYGFLRKELCQKNGISSSTVAKLFGSYQNFYKEVGYNTDFRRDVPVEAVRKDILEFITETGSKSITDYKKAHRYSQSIIDRCGGWHTILVDIGVEPKKWRNGKDNIIKQTRELINKYGYLSSKLIEDNCDFTLQALEYYLGNADSICKYFGNEHLFDYGRSSQELRIAELLKDILGVGNFSREVTWDWLLSDSGNHLYVDFYIDSLKVAIEYDGEQHYKYVERFHRNYDGFLEYQRSDNIKSSLLAEHNIKLIRISYTQEISEKYLRDILSKQN